MTAASTVAASSVPGCLAVRVSKSPAQANPGGAGEGSILIGAALADDDAPGDADPRRYQEVETLVIPVRPECADLDPAGLAVAALWRIDDDGGCVSRAVAHRGSPCSGAATIRASNAIRSRTETGRLQQRSGLFCLARLEDGSGEFDRDSASADPGLARFAIELSSAEDDGEDEFEPPNFLGLDMWRWALMARTVFYMGRGMNGPRPHDRPPCLLDHLGIFDAVQAWIEAEDAQRKRQTVARRKATREGRNWLAEMMPKVS
jgi:hypothetical protein